MRCRPRLRSMKKTGGSSGHRERGTDEVLDVGCLEVEVLGYAAERLSGLEALQNRLDGRTTVHEEWLAESSCRVNHEDRALGDGENDSQRPGILRRTRLAAGTAERGPRRPAVLSPPSRATPPRHAAHA